MRKKFELSLIQFIGSLLIAGAIPAAGAFISLSMTQTAQAVKIEAIAKKLEYNTERYDASFEKIYDLLIEIKQDIARLQR
ncbi:hypothetical protein [uncultured Paraglaciecola sp.]|uniref:hypothetical protein n=1 Tax=uncultured Paraglaciecola sp. TaxID=1765024 RepID=UPI002633C4F2|nr:hypothetical protein [uncultured Paraglaciecola sp.]